MDVFKVGAFVETVNAGDGKERLSNQVALTVLATDAEEAIVRFKNSILEGKLEYYAPPEGRKVEAVIIRSVETLVTVNII